MKNKLNIRKHHILLAFPSFSNFTQKFSNPEIPKSKMLHGSYSKPANHCKKEKLATRIENYHS